MQKKGISATVAIILMVAMTVVSVGIIWAAVFPAVREDFSFAGQSTIDLTIETIGGYTYWDENEEDGGSGLACVQVKRGIDETNLAKLKVFFSIEGNSEEWEFTDVPEVNGAVKQCFGPLDSKPESARIVPVFMVGSSEVVGPVISKISGGDIPEGSSVVDEEIQVCNDDGVCDEGEDNANCPNDCYCGDGTCNNEVCAAIGCPIPEDNENCPDDCNCGDGLCLEAFENSKNCFEDCGEVKPSEGK